jgi:DNA-binding MarR family transcriptional regulator/GNAT superfamily N-acetyltransferase
MIASQPSEIARSIDAFRRFNRFYTGFIGLLDEGLVRSGYSLTEARILFELATRSKSGAAEIAETLRLDPGYLSRILRKFEENGLLSRAPLPADARHSLLRLTRKGKNAFADLNKRSTEQARAILEAMTPVHRAACLQSMSAIERALDTNRPQPPPFILRPHHPGDMGWVVQRQSILYVEEYGWNTEYEALASRIVADFIEHFDPRREGCWVAERDGEPLGCVFLVRHPDEKGTARLRLLHVERAARGLGLGKALVAECLRFARSTGYNKVTLWTQSILHAAHKIYHDAGFKLVAEKPHHSFGVDLVGQTWDLNL